MTELEGTYSRAAALNPNSEFAYPTAFYVEEFKPLEKMAGYFDRPHHQIPGSGLPEEVRIGARNALIRWAQSPIGYWQSRQTARYPSEHIDLPAKFADVDDISDTAAVTAFRKEHLALMAHDPSNRSSVHRFGDASLDLHPVGHMALISESFDRMLIQDILADTPKDDFLMQAARHAAALHDIGESEHPGFRLLHGSVVGDIGANVGKTAEDRILERKILEDSLHVTFEGLYSDEFISTIAKFVSHDMTDASDLLRRYHDLLEINHDLNSLSTAKHIGKRGLALVESHPQHANIMTDLANESYVRISGGKLPERLEHSGVPLVVQHGEISLHGLYTIAHYRDFDPQYQAWRERWAT